MADLRELTTDAKRLYEAMDELLEKQEIKPDDVDFKEIWVAAKMRPFYGHIIETLDNYESDHYLKILAAMVDIAKETKHRTMQIGFLARVLAAKKDVKWELGDLISEGKMLQEKTLNQILELNKSTALTGLSIDLLLMIYLDGTPEKQQLDYAIGVLSLFGWKADEIKAIGKVARGILEQNDDTVLAQHSKIDIKNVYCYMKNPPDGELVFDLEAAKKIKEDKIIFYGNKWEAIPVINTYLFKANIIEFRNCVFEASGGMLNVNKKIILNGCVFKNCEVNERLLFMKDTKIIDCEFNNIKLLDGDNDYYLMTLYDSEICNSKFQNISIWYNTFGSETGLLLANNCNLKKIYVDCLEMKGKHDTRCDKDALKIYSSIMNDCIFNRCKLDVKTCLLQISKNTQKNNIKIDNLESEYKPIINEGEREYEEYPGYFKFEQWNLVSEILEENKSEE